MNLPKSSVSLTGALPDTAKDLLKKWLSVSESQICAIEVLCAQIPEVRVLLENNMTGISEKFIQMAADFEKYDNSIKEMLQFVSEGTSLEKSLQDIKGLLIKAEESSAQTAQAMEALDTLISNTRKNNAVLSDIHELADNITEHLSQIIIEMQFQDRVSQNLVITVNVLDAMIKYLQEEIDGTISNLDKNHEHAKLDENFARKLIALLTLGELQHKFVNHLVTHGYITTPEDIGYDPGSAANQNSGDIDLF